MPSLPAATPASKNNIADNAPQNGGSKITATGAIIHTELISNLTSGIPDHYKPRKILVKKKAAPKDYKPLLWLVGHCLTLLFGMLHLGSHVVLFGHQKGLIVRFFYIFAIFGVLDSYSISVLVNFGASAGTNFFALITTENFQYLLLAVIWLFSRPSVFKILPYVLISFLQLCKHYKKLDDIPKSVLKSLALIMAYNELVLIFGLFLDTILLRGTSGYSLVAFLGFYWLRIIYSESTKFFFFNFTDVVEQRIIRKYCPKDVQQIYKQFVASARLRGEEIEKMSHAIHKEEIHKREETATKLQKLEAPSGATVKAEAEKEKGFDTKKNAVHGDVKISAGEIPPTATNNAEKKKLN